MFGFKKRARIGSKSRSLSMAFRALFTGLCFSAFAIFGWDVDIQTVLELILLLMLVVLAMIVPAALFVALMKLIPYGLKRIRGAAVKNDVGNDIDDN